MDRRGIIIERFENVSDCIKSVVEKYEKKIEVEPTRVYFDEHGNEKCEKSHYSEKEKIVRIDKNKCNEEYIKTFKHEMGHYIDDHLGGIASSDDFEAAIYADITWYDNNNEFGIQNRERMIEEIINSDVADDRYVSDIMSAIFLNDKKIIKKYDDVGATFYGHDTEYWLEEKGPKKAVNKEVFADVFAIYVENDKSSIFFVEKFLPNITCRFKQEMQKRGG